MSASLAFMMHRTVGHARHVLQHKVQQALHHKEFKVTRCDKHADVAQTMA